MAGARDAVSELASTIQSAHINPAPSAIHDLNPSTSASRKIPVHVHPRQRASSSASTHKHSHGHNHNYKTQRGSERINVVDAEGEVEEDGVYGDEGYGDGENSEFPLSLLDAGPEPVARKPNLPPLPDLRFEQSYLARIKPFQDKGEWGRVALVTLQDHVVLPLTQGIVWNLALFGWRSWNARTAFKGQSLGARVRRWWWGVNNWDLPPVRPHEKEL